MLFRKLISKIQFKYIFPYFLLLSLLISTALLSYLYVLPMYYRYMREQQEIKFLKNKIRVDYEKIRIFKIIKSFNSGLPIPEEKKVSALIFNLGRKYKINPALILAVIRVESSFNNFSYSDMGAVGLMQIKPITGLYLIKKYSIKSKKFNYNTHYIEYLPVNYLYNPSLNIRIGARYLLSLLYEFKDLKLALFAYNVGPTFVYRTLKLSRKNGGSDKFSLNGTESTNHLFSDFYYGYYKRVKKYFAVYNKDIYKYKNRVD
jgi:soluble lytic murein transglycosylase-like protein